MVMMMLVMRLDRKTRRVGVAFGTETARRRRASITVVNDSSMSGGSTEPTTDARGVAESRVSVRTCHAAIESRVSQVVLFETTMTLAGEVRVGAASGTRSGVTVTGKIRIGSVTSTGLTLTCEIVVGGVAGTSASVSPPVRPVDGVLAVE